VRLPTGCRRLADILLSVIRGTLPEADFYVSGTFWLTVAVVVLTLALIVLTYFTLVVARNRRALRWEQRTVPILRNDRRQADDLRVLWRGTPVTSPTLATVVLQNVSRSDIGSTLFDGERPMTVRFDAEVLGLLEPEATENDGLLPVRLDGNDVHVGPGLFKKGQEVTIVALTAASTKCSVLSPLENVKVREEPHLTESQTSKFGGIMFGIVLSGTVVAITLLVHLLLR
jgi:hypothetical protein